MITEFSTSERIAAAILIAQDVPFSYDWKLHRNAQTGKTVDVIEFSFKDDSGVLNTFVESFQDDVLNPPGYKLIKSRFIHAQRIIAKIIKLKRGYNE